jgi:hypothetical protein
MSIREPFLEMKNRCRYGINAPPRKQHLRGISHGCNTETNRTIPGEPDRMGWLAASKPFKDLMATKRYSSYLPSCSSWFTISRWRVAHVNPLLYSGGCPVQAPLGRVFHKLRADQITRHPQQSISRDTSTVSIPAEAPRQNRYGRAGCLDSCHPATSGKRGSVPNRIW